MALLQIPLEQITEAHLQALIDAKVPESRTIDYKRQTYGNANTDNSELLADISSFANTTGGDIVLGIESAGGIPTALAPLIIDLDAEKLRFEQLARDGLRPRIINLDFRAVPISGGQVLIVRVPRSFSAPHRVVRQGSNRFWARSAAGKYEPDVDELRQLFLAAPQLADRIRNFRLDRIAKIAADDGPVRLMKRGTLVIHIVPLSSFDAPPVLSLRDISRDYSIFAPIGSSSAQSSRINFDGVLKLSNADRDAKEQRAYVQLYRSGIVEAVNSTIRHSEQLVVFNLEDSLAANLLRLISDLARTGIEPPYAVLVSILGVHGARMNLARGNNKPRHKIFKKPLRLSVPFWTRLRMPQANQLHAASIKADVTSRCAHKS